MMFRASSGYAVPEAEVSEMPRIGVSFWPSTIMSSKYKFKTDCPSNPPPDPQSTSPDIPKVNGVPNVMPAGAVVNVVTSAFPESGTDWFATLALENYHAYAKPDLGSLTHQYRILSSETCA